jgi:hypothetical protein
MKRIGFATSIGFPAGLAGYSGLGGDDGSRVRDGAEKRLGRDSYMPLANQSGDVFHQFPGAQSVGKIFAKSNETIAAESFLSQFNVTHFANRCSATYSAKSAAPAMLKILQI